MNNYNPTLSIHTHCQVARKTNRTSQNLSKSMAAPQHTKKESTGIQQCINLIAAQSSRTTKATNFILNVAHNIRPRI